MIINEVILNGKLNKNTTIRQTKNGDPYSMTSMGCGTKKADGSYISEWFSLKIFTPVSYLLQNNLNEYLENNVQIVGSLHTEKDYKDNSIIKYYILVESIAIVPSKDYVQKQSNFIQQDTEIIDNNVDTLTDDDLPF